MAIRSACRTVFQFGKYVLPSFNIKLNLLNSKSNFHFTTFLNNDKNNSNDSNVDSKNNNNKGNQNNVPPNNSQQFVDFEKSSIYQNLKEKIHTIVEQEKIVLFMKGTPEKPLCGYSANVVNILSQMNLEEYIYIDVLKNIHLKEAIKLYSNWPYIPILYVNKEFIGGHDIISDMYHSGQLSNVLK